MISFEKTLELENLSEEELDYYYAATAAIESNPEADYEIKYALSDFCLIARIFDYGRYSFIYPLPLSERADEKAALLAVNEYAMREEIERIISDVPKESLPNFFDLFRHLDIDAMDRDGESFRVKIKTECELLDEIPDFNFGKISLGAPTDSDAENYARLIRDEETNKYWGYDFREDFSEKLDDSFFVENAKMEFMRGAAITLAVKEDETFIGEVTYYAFDGMGGAEIAIRLLPEARGRHLGDASFEALVEFARNIGLTRLTAFVDKRNERSISYMSKNMKTSMDADTRVKFSLDLY